jgi:hypothetical protein
MATVNKDFKIKSGLVVEGTTGTINNQAILTEGAGDAYILDLIGGETLITSVESTQMEVVSGELNIKSGVFDADGAAAAAEAAANLYTDGEITTALTTAQGYADAAETSANSYTDGRETAITSAYQTYADTAETDAVASAATYTDGEITTALTTAQGYATTAENNANSYTDTALEDYTPTSGLDSAVGGYGYLKSADLSGYATESYVNTAVDNLVDGAPGLLDTLNELAAAINDDENYATTMTTALAGKQGTLTAGSNIDITADTISVTGLASTDISDFNTAALSATSSAYDAAGSASDVQDNLDTHTNASSAHGVSGDIVGTSDSQTLTNKTIDASSNTISNIANSSLSNSSITVNGYSTSLGDTVTLDTDDVAEGTAQYFTDTRAKASAASLLTGASLANITITGDESGLTITAENGVADSTTDDLTEGEENLYFTDERAIDAVSNADIYPNAVIIDNVAKQVASQITAATAGIQVGHAFAKADYRSAEFLVKVAYGTHTEISKVLLTLDTSDNIAITEYGIVGTNGSASTISADISGTDVRLLVTTANNNSTVTVIGTLLI